MHTIRCVQGIVIISYQLAFGRQTVWRHYNFNLDENDTKNLRNRYSVQTTDLSIINYQLSVIN